MYIYECINTYVYDILGNSLQKCFYLGKIHKICFVFILEIANMSL